MSETEKGPFYDMREVSELRMQYQCEYRLLLKRKFGEAHSSMSITGTKLHQRVALVENNQNFKRIEIQLLPLLVIILALIIGVFWILG
ncbi:MAG: hypothetical protein ACFFDQ_02490 [Candidatus Thorarchaeota archaeon]